MGGASRGLTRRSFVAAGALGVGALALRPRRTIAEVLDARSPVGLWGVARTDDGLIGLWSAGDRPSIVRLSDRGPVEVARVLATPDPGVAVAIAVGLPATALGAVEDAAPVGPGIRIDHLPASIGAALADEVDGPLSVVGAAADAVLPRRAVARLLDGSAAPVELPAVPGGIAASVLRAGGSVWSAVQHPATGEGDHCSSLTVSLDGRAVLEVDDLGSAGPAVLAGPAHSPLVSVVDDGGRVRAWVLGAEPAELPVPGGADEVAVHVAGGRPIALLASPDGINLLGHGPSGWEVLRDVPGTTGARRVLAVSGVEPEFLVEVDDGVRLVDGEGNLR